MHGRDIAVRMLVTVVGMLGGVGLLAPAASAGPIVDSTGDCEVASVSTPFSRWLDPMAYTEVRDAGIERRAQGWTLRGGAAPVAGNEPWKVRDPQDDSSLRLPAGSSATTAPICVGLAEPTLRFFAKGSMGLLDGLHVEVLFEDTSGNVHDLPIGVDGGGPWHPTTLMPVIANLLPLLPGQQTPVSFRFTARGGDFQIDDVYVDPWCMR